MKNKKIKYIEPADYFPKEIREKCRIGEYAVLDKNETNNDTTKKNKSEENNHN